jgi:tripartite-type tricarboxylate transporter receptor subunit TctC
MRTISSKTGRWSSIAALVAISLGLAACGSAASTSSQTGSTSGTSLLAQGLKFYKGKTITFISPDSPGGGFDQYALDYEPVLASYLHATVIVQSDPAGNTIAGQDAVAAAKPNGLTVGWLNAGPDIEDNILNLPGLSFNPSQVAILGGSAPSVDAVALSPSSACKASASWAHIIKTSTSKDPVKEVIQTTGTTTLALVLANGIFGVHAMTIPGYASSSALLAGFERGDGCIFIDPASTVGPLVKGGQAIPLLVSVPVQKSDGYYKEFEKTPSFADVERQFSSSIKTTLQKNGVLVLNEIANSSRGFYAPKGTPADEVAALEAAFKSASSNSNLEKELVKQGNPTGYQTPAEVLQNYKTFLAAAKKVTSYLGPIRSGA